jgi:hypothetical protein
VRVTVEEMTVEEFRMTIEGFGIDFPPAKALPKVYNHRLVVFYYELLSQRL